MNGHGQRGQAIIEYILLMAIIVSLSTTILNGPEFKKYLGDSVFFKEVKKAMAFSYRYAHGLPGSHEDYAFDPASLSRHHNSYYNKKKADSHFAIGTTRYP